MVAAAAEPVNTHETGKPNYSHIYLYISSLLKGETPQALPPLESSVVLSLIQEIVNKIRKCDLTGQLNFLASSYQSFVSDSADKDRASSGNHAGEKELNSSKEKGQKKSDSTTRIPKSTESAIKRTSSGRVVRQRVQLVAEDSDDVDEADSEQEKKLENTSNKTECSSSKPKPTSLNPFRIPVNLLNFKPI